MRKKNLSRQMNGEQMQDANTQATPYPLPMQAIDPDFSQPSNPGPIDPDFSQPSNPGPIDPDFSQPSNPDPIDPDFSQPSNPDPIDPDFSQPPTPGGIYPLPTPVIPGGGIIGGIGVVPVPGITIWPRQLCYIRFLHAAPDTPNVDIFANGRLIASNVSYQGFTEYFRATPGLYTIQVYGTGRRVRPVFTARINLFSNMIYTAAVSGDRGNVELELISDRPRSLSQNTAYMRFINLSPDSPELDIYVNDRLVISRIEYQEVSNYLTMRPGTYSIAFKIAGTQDTVLYDPNATLRGGVAYATFLVGKFYGSPGLEVLIPMEGVTYLRFNR